MKKWLLVLGMVTSILSMSACGSGQEANVARADITEADAVEDAKEKLQMVISGCQEENRDQRLMVESQSPVFAAAFSSWESAQADIGDLIEISEESVQITEDGAVIHLKLDGSSHDAEFEVIWEGTEYKLTLSSITTNVEYSGGELMKKAGLNTLLGMGTVFTILILISLIISCFNFIPKIQAAFTKKQPQDEKKAAAVDNTIAQIVEKEELSDDLELVAVIAAAVAASEGAVSTDGFVVRSIRKRKY